MTTSAYARKSAGPEPERSTGQIVAFASRYGEKGALRKKETKAGNPDVYPIAMGLTKVKEKKDYEPIQQLAKLRDSKPGNPARNP